MTYSINSCACAAAACVQNRAVDVVSDAVLRSRAGLSARNRGSSFLFLVSLP